MRLLMTALLVLVASTSIVRASTFNCVVGDFFVGKSAKANLTKRFILTEADDNVIVTSISAEFENSQRLYKVTSKDLLGNIYASDVTTTSHHTISIQEQSDGSADATVVGQSGTFVTVWMLSCNQ